MSGLSSPAGNPQPGNHQMPEDIKLRLSAARARRSASSNTETPARMATPRPLRSGLFSSRSRLRLPVGSDAKTSLPTAAAAAPALNPTVQALVAPPARLVASRPRRSGFFSNPSRPQPPVRCDTETSSPNAAAAASVLGLTAQLVQALAGSHAETSWPTTAAAAPALDATAMRLVRHVLHRRIANGTVEVFMDDNLIVTESAVVDRYAAVCDERWWRRRRCRQHAAVDAVCGRRRRRWRRRRRQTTLSKLQAKAH